MLVLLSPVEAMGTKVVALAPASKLNLKKLASGFLIFVGSVYADQVKVNIVYPINGASYPKMDPALGKLRFAYFTVSFSVTCKGGPHKVEWGFDGAPALGSAKFYYQTSIQLAYKLPAGEHIFWVKSDCGRNRVKFTIGS